METLVELAVEEKPADLKELQERFGGTLATLKTWCQDAGVKVSTSVTSREARKAEFAKKIAEAKAAKAKAKTGNRK